jgi:hypothetical protein
MLGLGSFSCTLVITSERVLVAELTSAMRTEAARQAAEQARAQGKGWMAGAAAVWQSHAGYAQRYLQQTIAHILQESARNFAIPRAVVRSVRLENASLLRSTEDDRATNTQCRMNVRTSDDHYTFEFASAQLKAAELLLAQAGLMAGRGPLS